jgi:hypothetical protein
VCLLLHSTYRVGEVPDRFQVRRGQSGLQQHRASLRPGEVAPSFPASAATMPYQVKRGGRTAGGRAARAAHTRPRQQRRAAAGTAPDEGVRRRALRHASAKAPVSLLKDSPVSCIVSVGYTWHHRDVVPAARGSPAGERERTGPRPAAGDAAAFLPGRGGFIAVPSAASQITARDQFALTPGKPPATWRVTRCEGRAEC